MSELRPVLERLRDLLTPPPDADGGLLRYRRRKLKRRRLSTASIALAVSAASLGALVYVFLGTEQPRPAATFPGGGRVLFKEYGSEGFLAWAYPDGRIRRIAGGYLGAKLIPGFPHQLLAWKIRNEDYDYYLMGADGSNQRHVLAPTHAEGNVPGGYEKVQVSPDGAKLAYLRYTTSQVAPTKARFELMVMDLATRKTTDLGPAGPFTHCCYSVIWNDDSVLLLMQGPEGRAVEWVNVQDRKRGTYLPVDDPRVVSAYGQAWPGIGPPTEISPIGWGSGPNFAVLVSQADGRQQAVVVLRNDGVVGFAPKDGRPNLSFRWGPSGTSLLLAYVAPRAGGRTGSLYVGDVGSLELRHVTDVSDLRGEPLLNPTGSVIMFPEDLDSWRFVRVGRASQPTTVNIEGFPFDWSP
jgi:hypothetical protein